MGRKVMCGTPQGKCSGSKMSVNAWLGGSAGQKVHADSPEAFKCYRAYLISEGYTALGSREMLPPDGGMPSLCLSPCLLLEVTEFASGRALPLVGSYYLLVARFSAQYVSLLAHEASNFACWGLWRLIQKPIR